MRIGCSWSGGKDSCYALMKLLKEGHELKVILNVMDENLIYSKSHGITLDVLKAQAFAMMVPLVTVPASWKSYEENFIKSLKTIKAEYQIDSMVFGDIDIEKHKLWEEKVSNASGINAALPIWQQNRRDLVLSMIEDGVEAIIVSCNHDMGTDFLGRQVDQALISELEERGIDACGENGEYHTLVINTPLFKKKIMIETLDKVKTENYCFLTTQLKL